MNTPDFRPGFRLSAIDVIVLLLGTVWSLLLHGMGNPLGMAVFFTLSHFFLFCNVLRMRRTFEMIWAAFFLLLATQTMLYHVPSWPRTFSVMLGITTVLAGVQMRQVAYHGIFWKQLNPDLPQWWAERRGKSSC